MSRAGYSDECENIWLWRSNVERALRGTRGQQFLRELRDVLDAMPKKELGYYDLQPPDGFPCALGAVGAARGIDMTGWDPEDWRRLSKALGIAETMVKEIEFENDEGPYAPGDAERWGYMRRWADGWIK